MRLVPLRQARQADNIPARAPTGGEGHASHGAPKRRRAKNRRAFAAALAAAIALLLCAVPATYSYLTASSETVVNTFAGGTISLTLDEAKVDTDGTPVDGEERVQENTYKVIPGATLYKDPTVTVLEGSVVCYVYLYVENPLDADYFTLDYSEDWISIATTGAKTLYVYKTTVDAADGDVALTPIFTTVTVSGELTSEQIEAMGEVQIKVQAYAVQADSLDSETSIQMAASYFETEFDFEWTDVDTSVEIEDLTAEEEGDPEATDSEDTSSNSAKEESSEEESSAEESSDEESSAETASADASALEEASDEADASAEESGSADASDEAAESTSSEESSEGSSEDDTASESSDASYADAGTVSSDPSDGTGLAE